MSLLMSCISSAETARDPHSASLITSEHADEGEEGFGLKAVWFVLSK